MFVVWLILLILALTEGLNSLRCGIQQVRCLIPSPENPARNSFTPSSMTSLVIPCRGLEEGFEKNITAFFNLLSTHLKLIFVIDSKSDPAYPTLMQLCKKNPNNYSEILVAGPAKNCGQKVHNLKFAIEQLPNDQKTFVFADSDIRPLPDWLQALLKELRRKETGLSTGFRWYLCSKEFCFASCLRSAWNAGILSRMNTEKCDFGWGGALACSREIFEECGGKEIWNGSLSDDYSLSSAVKNQNYKIRFVPRALSLSYASCSLRQLLDWSTRQISITRVYSPTLWKMLWPVQLLYFFSVWMTPFLVLAPEDFSDLNLRQRIILGTIGLMVVGFSSIKAHLRLKMVASILPEKSKQILCHAWLHRIAPPFCSLVTLQALFRSLFSKKILWKGIQYEMQSATQTRILSKSKP